MAFLLDKNESSRAQDRKLPRPTGLAKRNGFGHKELPTGKALASERGLWPRSSNLKIRCIHSSEYCRRLRQTASLRLLAPSLYRERFTEGTGNAFSDCSASFLFSRGPSRTRITPYIGTRPDAQTTSTGVAQEGSAQPLAQGSRLSRATHYTPGPTTHSLLVS